MRAIRHLRISLAGLLGLVLILGVWLALLRSTSYLAVHIAFSATLVLLLTSIVLAIYRQGPRRAFWVGFLIFGFGILIPTMFQWAWNDESLMSDRADPAVFLVTTVAFKNAYLKFSPDPIVDDSNEHKVPSMEMIRTYNAWSEKGTIFCRVGDVLVVVFAGFGGGVLASAIEATRESRKIEVES